VGRALPMEHHPEVHGDCCLNGEPSSRLPSARGERPVLAQFTLHTIGATAHTRISPSATKQAARLIVDLEEVTTLRPSVRSTSRCAGGRRRAIDEAQGRARRTCPARHAEHRVIHGGVKVNIVPARAGSRRTSRPTVRQGGDPGEDREIVARYPERRSRRSTTARRASAIRTRDDGHPACNARALAADPAPIVSLGGTDARLWRQRGISALVHGAVPRGNGAGDEHVEIEEFLHVVRMHVLSSFDYLSR